MRLITVMQLRPVRIIQEGLEIVRKIIVMILHFVAKMRQATIILRTMIAVQSEVGVLIFLQAMKTNRTTIAVPSPPRINAADGDENTQTNNCDSGSVWIVFQYCNGHWSYSGNSLYKC